MISAMFCHLSKRALSNRGSTQIQWKVNLTEIRRTEGKICTYLGTFSFRTDTLESKAIGDFKCLQSVIDQLA